MLISLMGGSLVHVVSDTLWHIDAVEGSHPPHHLDIVKLADPPERLLRDRRRVCVRSKNFLRT
jgi:hypothetical protein